MSAKKSKSSNPLALGLALVISGGVFVGGALRLAPHLLPAGSLTGALGGAQCSDPDAQVQLTALGDTFSGYSTLRNPAFQGSLSEVNLGLCYQDEFDQEARAAAIAEGQADLIVTTLDQYLTHQPPGKIVALIDRTIGADAVVLNTRQFQQLTSLLELEKLVAERAAQGQKLKIIFAGDTPSEFLALVLDTKFDNFNLADFEVIRVADASIAWEQMQTDPDIALGVLWEPFVNAARQQGNTVVLSSQDAPKVIVDVLIASDRALTENPQAVASFVSTYYRRIDSSLQDQELLTRQIAADGNLLLEDAIAIREGISFFTSVEAQNWMNSGELAQRIEAIAAILALANRLPSVPQNIAELYTAQYIEPVAQNTAQLLETIAQNDPDLAKRLQAAKAPPQATPVSAAQAQNAPNIGNLTVRGEVNFATGSAQLTPQSNATLQQLAQEIQEFNPGTVGIKVQGHTSQTGAADVNQRLSQQRAQVVVDFLKQQQQLQHSVFAEGLGYSQPLPGIAPNAPQNQRTVIRLIRLTP
ncbi:MAG: phosphate ABC transporter substrate-binding/OmpA family protein [Spirulinaceae cyanobacterium]